MSHLALLPNISPETSLNNYLKEIQKFPMLSETEEQNLAKKWRDFQDIEAAHKLVTSHLKLVAKVAMRFRGYGLPLVDLISEGNIGLMHAVKKFDPDMGHRLSTYALWWIKATIQEYVLRSWSMVKLGTSAAQKKLFFNLRKIKNRLSGQDNDDVTTTNIIANELGVSRREVQDMDNRLTNYEVSLNTPAYKNDTVELIDLVPGNEENQEYILFNKQDSEYRNNLLTHSLSELKDRERDIIKARKLQERPVTLEALSQKYGVSRERIRQIEEKALEKLTKSVQAKAYNTPALQNKLSTPTK